MKDSIEPQMNKTNEKATCFVTVLDKNDKPFIQKISDFDDRQLNYLNTGKLQLLGKSVDLPMTQTSRDGDDSKVALPDRSQSVIYPGDLPLKKILEESGQQRRCPKCFTLITENDHDAEHSRRSTASLKKGLTLTSAASSSPTGCSSTEPRNPFYEVSNEYMRVSGYAQQFARFLQKNRRRRLADPSGVIVGSPQQQSMPLEPCLSPTMARTFSLKRPGTVEHPVYHLIAETGDHNGSCPGAKTGHKISNEWTTSTDGDHVETLEEAQRTNLCSPYGILWKVPPNFKRIKKRKQLFVLKTRACYLSLFFAIAGIALAVLDAELVANHHILKTSLASQMLRTLVVSTTLVLVIFIVWYHAIEIQISLIDSGAYDWQVTVTADRDAATRSIASLNRVAVNFAFVAKTLMFEHPLRVLCSFTLCFWVVLAWLFMHCERLSRVPEDNGYLNALWFIMITFKSIGYGDIVPNTYCGRALAITAGIVGAAVSSALIAVISNKLELSRAEKHVNNFMADSKLAQMRKHSAAMVLQHTWFIHKYREVKTTKDEMKLRFHQRRFLSSINQFRKVKWDQRKLAEQGNALVDLAKLQNDTYTMIYRMQQSIERLAVQISLIRKDDDIRFDKCNRRTPADHSKSKVHL